jgi:hypothetical protein
MQNGNPVAVFDVCSLSPWERVRVRASDRTIIVDTVSEAPPGIFSSSEVNHHLIPIRFHYHTPLAARE